MPAASIHRVFLLSPANCGGRRATLLLNGAGTTSLGARLHNEGAPLGEVFSFLSGLYFRGKLAYANAFSKPPEGIDGELVITPNRGLVPATRIIDIDVLREFASIDIDLNDPGYREPVERDARTMLATGTANCEMILLGSLATPKYLSLLSPIFGERLRYPTSFVGRGDMSRGALMLRCVEQRQELEYAAATGDSKLPPELEG